MSDNALTVAVPAGYREWRSVASLAVDAVSSAHSKRAYEKALQVRRPVLGRSPIAD